MLGDLIPEKRGEVMNVTMDTDDGMVVIRLDDKEVLNTTCGDAKLILLLLIEAFGRKFTKKLMKTKLKWEET